MGRKLAILALGIIWIGVGWTQEKPLEVLQKTQQNLERRFEEIREFLSERKRPNHSYEIAEQFFDATKLLTGPLPYPLEEIAHRFDRISLRLDVVKFLIEKAPLIPKPELATDREKARRNVITQLENWERTELPKLQILRAAKDRDGKDTQDTMELFVSIENLLKTLKVASRQADAEELLALWPGDSERLMFLAKGIERMLKSRNLPMRYGVTKKQIERERQEEDKRSGCAQYMPDDDRYSMCKKGVMPARINPARGNFAFRLDDPEARQFNLPPECPRDFDGSPIIQNPPGVEIWEVDDLYRGKLYYAFIGRSSTTSLLITKQQLTFQDREQAAISACRNLPSESMQLVYVGSYPVDTANFLHMLFQVGHRPVDAFGMEGMRAVAMELKPVPPFVIEAFLFDKTFAELGRRINATINPFNTWRQETWKSYADLMESDRVRILNLEERETLDRLQKSPEIAFLKKFNDELRKGLEAGKTNYLASADALGHSVEKLPDTHAKKTEILKLEEVLRPIAVAYDTHIDENIKKLAIEKHSDTEYVFRLGESVFMFFKTTGNVPPKLSLSFEIERLSMQPDASVTGDPFGTLLRSSNIPPGNELRLITFAKEGQKYWIAYFNTPFAAYPLSTRFRFPDGREQVLNTSGVLDNKYLVVDTPDYIGTIRLTDEETKREAPPVTIRFSVVP